MNLTVELSERGVRDGVFLVGAYHFLLAVGSLLGTLAIFVYAVLPPIADPASTPAQSLFLPIMGSLVCIFLTVAYASVGMGLIRMKNSARMAAIFLSLFGILAGVFGFLGGAVAAANQTSPNWTAIGMVGLIMVCVYTLVAFLDIMLLVFLLNGRVRSVFYAEEWRAGAVEEISTPSFAEEIESKKSKAAAKSQQVDYGPQP